MNDDERRATSWDGDVRILVKFQPFNTIKIISPYATLAISIADEW